MNSLTPTDLQAGFGLFVGILTTFMTVSYVASNTTEALGSILRWRENFLLAAVKDLLKDPTFQGLAKEIYINPLVNPRLNLEGAIISEAQLKVKPASINPEVFALALMQTIHLFEPDSDQPFKTREQMIDAVTGNIQSEYLRKVVKALINNAPRNATPEQLFEIVRDAIAKWYLYATEQVTEVYRRRTQMSNLAVGFLLAAMLDLQPIPLAIAHGDAIPSGATEFNLAAILTPVFEWLVVALSTPFGAEFWYHILQWATRENSDKGNGAAKPSGNGPS
jgi:hypothetical protein